MCGEAKNEEATVREKPFVMGHTLNGTSKLDINMEMTLMQKKIDELRAMNADENVIKYTMKDYGIERFIKFLFFSFFFIIVPHYA